MATKVQAVANNNGAVAATTVAATLTATGYNNILVAFVFCAVAGATITPPAGQGWVSIDISRGTNPVGGTMAMFVSYNNPGGITTVTFTVTSSLASIVVYEVSGLPTNGNFGVDLTAGNSNSNNTSFGTGNKVLQNLGETVLAAVGYINNTAITATWPGGLVEDTNTITSNAAGNAGLRSASVMANPTGNMNYGGGTLSGVPSNGPVSYMICFLGYIEESTNGYVGPQNYLG